MLSAFGVLGKIPAWVWVALVLVGLLVVSRMQVDSAKSAHQSDKASWAAANAESERQARADEWTRFKNAERVRDETVKRDAASRAAAAAAGRAAAGLLAHIQAANSVPVPEDPRAAELAHAARAARELLGACAERHRDLASGADALRDQVIGLQSFITGSCGVKP